MNNPRKARIATAAVLVASFVAAFATVGGVGIAESAVSAIQKQYGGGKVTICHKGKKTITVAKAAAPAHAKHGDTVGTCARAAKAKKAKAAKAKAAKAKAAKAKAAKAEAKKAETETSGSSGKEKGKGK